MIRTTLLLPSGEIIQQPENLLEQWRATPGSFCWVDFANEDPTTEAKHIAAIGGHPLVIKDAQRTRHPPKTEIFDDLVFMLYRGLGEVGEELVLEQISIALFAGDDFLLTRHNGKSHSINQWFESPELPQLIKRPLLLAARIIHSSFGRYLEAVLDFEAYLAEKEEIMQQHPTDEDLKDLTAYKTRLRKLKRIFNYHERLAFNLLQFVKEHDDDEVLQLEHDVQDLHDRADRIASLLNMYYELCGDLIEGYLSITSHNLNKTMQILTVVTTIFVPLGFLAGIYGMNFVNIPELQYANGYFVLLGVMASIAATALIVFKWKKWL